MLFITKSRDFSLSAGDLEVRAGRRQGEGRFPGGLSDGPEGRQPKGSKVGKGFSATTYLKNSYIDESGSRICIWAAFRVLSNVAIVPVLGDGSREFPGSEGTPSSFPPDSDSPSSAVLRSQRRLGVKKWGPTGPYLSHFSRLVMEARRGFRAEAAQIQLSLCQRHDARTDFCQGRSPLLRGISRRPGETSMFRRFGKTDDCSHIAIPHRARSCPHGPPEWSLRLAFDA